MTNPDNPLADAAHIVLQRTAFYFPAKLFFDLGRILLPDLLFLFRRNKHQLLWSVVAGIVLSVIWVFPPAYTIEFVPFVLEAHSHNRAIQARFDRSACTPSVPEKSDSADQAHYGNEAGREDLTLL